MIFQTKLIAVICILSTFISSCAQPIKKNANTKFNHNMNSSNSKLDTITLAAGCFWCTEAVFQRLKGVDTVFSGYTGGSIENPTYKQVCTGTTGHAEAIQVIFDPTVISVTELLHVFFKTHDPTTLNQQGNDHGTQYRSGIFFHTPEQEQIAQNVIAEMNKEQVFDAPIVTEVTPFSIFYSAEDYHQNFYNNNQEYGYCRIVINPKLDKLEKYFKDKLK